MPHLNARVSASITQIHPTNPTEIVMATATTVNHQGEPDEIVFDVCSILTLVTDQGAATLDFGVDVLAFDSSVRAVGDDPVAVLEEQRWRLKNFMDAVTIFAEATEAQITDAQKRIEEFRASA